MLWSFPPQLAVQTFVFYEEGLNLDLPRDVVVLGQKLDARRIYSGGHFCFCLCIE